MPKLTETYAAKLRPAKSGTDKHWDSEIKGLGLFVGKRSKTWYFQKDVGGQSKRVLIGRYPSISAQAARQTAMGFALEWGRGAGKSIQVGAPTLEQAMEAYVQRPKLRSDEYRRNVRASLEIHLKDWLKLPLDEITKQMVVRRHQEMATHPVPQTARRCRVHQAPHSARSNQEQPVSHLWTKCGTHVPENRNTGAVKPERWCRL